MLFFFQQAARLHREAAAKDGPLSAVLAVILCVSLASPAFAAEIGHEGAVRQMAAREIESETARMLSSVAVQLEAQGQLDMLPIFEAIIADEVEARISAKYNLYPASNSESVMFYFPNCGAVGYEGPFYTTVLHTYMTPCKRDGFSEKEYWPFFIVSCLQGMKLHKIEKSKKTSYWADGIIPPALLLFLKPEWAGAYAFYLRLSLAQDRVSEIQKMRR